MRNKVRAMRTERGLTQEALGAEVGVSRQAVNAIETEKHDPSLSLAFRIAALFGEEVESVFENPHRNASKRRGFR